ncbi:peroxiredoxin-like family protein [Cesiribacter andamanensis]|uniref:Thiol-disulfide oxidoreductase n=1 Tax=Cesiribacter andamanensis AMV16 TaxID=1279009 RepID=M7N6T8_9BACT|nr:peroxiredoxin-like family protein [Cesiribacter andamanensis]EMR04308.1 thiol-disulfide oxidoreductase [Cesiribacter andamanensis AMV16]
MRLERNVVAPTFVLRDVFGRTIDLASYADKKVLIAFFRHAGCPFCNLRVHLLTKLHKELQQKGLEMIFFFESKEQIILRSTFHQEVSPVPIISDPEKKWYDAYGLETSLFKSSMGHLTTFVQTALTAKMTGVPLHPMADGESFSTMPAEFLLDRGLVVRELHYSQRLSDRMDLSAIKAFADSEAVPA